MSNKFCNLKYQQKVFSLHLDEAKSCCKSYPEPLSATETVQDRIRQWQHEAELLQQGVAVDNCNFCWKIENQGKLSHRHLAGQDHQQVNRLEIQISNLCNQMCSYCSPNYSSTWENSIQQQGMFKHISNTAVKNLQIPLKSTNTVKRLQQIESYIAGCEDNSISLALLGGEPLMQINSLQQLLALSSEKIKTLTIVTNLNPPKSKFLEWTLENFSKDKLHIKISLDATLEYNHVPRAGFQAHIFEKNLNLLKQHNVDIEFLATVSATSIFDLPNFLPWLDQNQFKAKFSMVYNPGCLDPVSVPFEFRQNILDKIATAVPTSIAEMLNNKQSQDDLKLFEQYNYLTQYFTRTGVDPSKIENPLFANYWQWLTDKYKK